ncbi:NACHT domain-containing protein [Geodermatophilus africanus]|nr:NACHT domain-containing protein [Geodermatophilus africanus]
MHSRSGQANEAGSVHRRGVAVYLAAHGLAGRPVAGADPGPGAPTPVALQFETAHATDDLLCTLSDQTRLFISAKRTCGNDAELRDTIAQWEQQVDHLQPGDRLVLATAEPKSIVRHLGAALRRRRKAPTSVPSVLEEAALRELSQQLTPCKRDRILDAAVILVIDAVEPGDPHHDVASALLEGPVVPAGDGVTALSHLERAFHTQAGTAYSGDVDQWVRELVDRGVTVYADLAGPAAAAARARAVAVEQYRGILTADAGRVDLTMLADDVEPLIVDDLADQLQVTVKGRGKDKDSVPLLTVARRRTRLMINGLPGAGKSAAMTQLAARWAGQPIAPLPVLVRLRDLLPTCTAASDVTVDRLCETAAASVPARHRHALVDGLLEHVLRGEAVLLLDGLDECLDRRAVIAQGLAQAVATLPADTGVVLTTRPSGVTAAGRLALDEVALTTPTGLEVVLEQLLRHIADVRVPAADRTSWVTDRGHRVREITRAHEDMGSVPLLAVLTTLVIADGSNPPAPEDTAAVLHRAVQLTASRWEQHRAQLPGARPGPTEGQLLEGFAAIGHLLSERAAPTVTDVDAAVAAMLTARWGQAAGPAAEASEAIRRFWDDHVGVFVAGRDNRVVARSRVFAEIGAAMHSERLPAEDLSRWVAAAVDDPDRHNALLLAAQLDSRVVDELLRPGDHADVRSRLAATGMRGRAGRDIDRAGRLLNLLTAAAARAAATEPGTPAPSGTSSGGRQTDRGLGDAVTEQRLRRDGPVWPWALEIARLPVPSPLNRRRLEVLAGLPLTEDQHRVGRGIAALAAADAASRALTPRERTDVLSMLTVPLPPKEEVRRVARNHMVFGTSPGLLAGLDEGTARAAVRLPELGEDAIEPIATIAPRAWYRTAGQIAAAMEVHGHHIDVMGVAADTWRFFAQIGEDFREASRKLLTTVAALSAQDVELTAAQRWRLPLLTSLLVSLSVDKVSVSDLRDVRLDPDPERQQWLRLMALGSGIDLAGLAAEARAAISEDAAAGDDRPPVPFSLAWVWPAADRRAATLQGADEEELAIAVSLLGAESDWIADSAVGLLWEATGVPRLNEQVAAILDQELSVGRRVQVAMLSCVLSPDPAASAARLLDDPDPALRRAAARLFRDAGEEGWAEDGRERALADEDVAVRIAAGAASLHEPGQPPPTYWSCTWCGERNDVTAETCQNCDLGRPTPARA